MSCKQIREWMLEAELEELAGRGDTAVAAHVRSCAGCRGVATTLLAETRALGDALESLAWGPEAVAPAVLGSRPALVTADPVAPPAPRIGRPDAPRYRRARRWAPLAAAAGVAGLLAIARGVDRPGAPLGDPSEPLDRPRAAMEGFTIEVPDGGRLAVFDTADPSIKVVWFY